MSGKERDAQPEHEETVPGGPDATPEDDMAAGEAVSDDEVIAELEEGFTEDEQAAAGSVIVRKTAKAPVRKDRPTRKRGETKAESEDQYKAGNPVRFMKQSVGELRKVVWPTWAQLVAMFFAVLMFVLFMIFLVLGLDLGFGALLLWLFGSNT